MDGEDRRVVRVTLTDSGLETFKLAHDHVTVALDRFLSLMEMPDRKAFIGILERLKQRVE